MVFVRTMFIQPSFRYSSLHRPVSSMPSQNLQGQILLFERAAVHGSLVLAPTSFYPHHLIRRSTSHEALVQSRYGLDETVHYQGLLHQLWYMGLEREAVAFRVPAKINLQTYGNGWLSIGLLLCLSKGMTSRYEELSLSPGYGDHTLKNAPLRCWKDRGVD